MKISKVLSGQAIMLARGLKRGAKARKICAPAHGRRVWGEHGNMLVEIAISMPLLLLVCTGIFDFGIAYYNQLTLTQAVGSGAQNLARIRTSTTDPCADTLTAIESAAPTLAPGKIAIAITMNGTSEPSNGTPTTNLSCSGAQSNLVQGTQVAVTATYPCSLPIVFTRGATWISSCQLSVPALTEYEY
jgi:Flp pilus assembly protein TadG